MNLKETRTGKNLQEAFRRRVHGSQQVHLLRIQSQVGWLCADLQDLRGDRGQREYAQQNAKYSLVWISQDSV